MHTHFVQEGRPHKFLLLQFWRWTRTISADRRPSSSHNVHFTAVFGNQHAFRAKWVCFGSFCRTRPCRPKIRLGKTCHAHVFWKCFQTVVYTCLYTPVSVYTCLCAHLSLHTSVSRMFSQGCWHLSCIIICFDTLACTYPCAPEMFSHCCIHQSFVVV